jgi:splicing factor 3A subunit 1
VQKLNLNTKTQEQQTRLMEQIFVPKDPPAEFEYIADAPSITPLDIDVIKLAAQFVARNGRSFLTNLMNKEQRNALFDFLKPQHSHFNYFTRLVEQYTKILLPQKDFETRLRKELNNPQCVLKDIQYRTEWCKYQQREKAREDELIEKERVAYAQIDWHDFVVVETVDYQSNEVGNFPPPTTPQDVGARVVAQERIEQYGDLHTTTANMDASLMERIIQEETEVNYGDAVHVAKTKDKINLQDKNIDEVAMDEDSDEEEVNCLACLYTKCTILTTIFTTKKICQHCRFEGPV